MRPKSHVPMLVSLAFLSLLVSCGSRESHGHSSSTTTKAIVKSGFSSPVLYRTEGPSVIQSICPNETRLYNGATCPLTPKTVSAKGFRSRIEQEVIGDLPVLEEQVRQTYVKISQLYTFILQFTEIDPLDHHTVDIKLQMDDLQVSIAEKDIIISELGSQKTAIEAALLGQSTTDLRMQLAEVLRQLHLVMAQRSTLLFQFEELRGRYIATASHILDQDTYDILMRQRATSVSQLTALQQTYGQRLNDATNLARVMKILEIAEVTIEYLDHTDNVGHYIVRHFGGVFQTVFDDERSPL